VLQVIGFINMRSHAPGTIYPQMWIFLAAPRSRDNIANVARTPRTQPRAAAKLLSIVINYFSAWYSCNLYYCHDPCTLYVFAGARCAALVDQTDVGSVSTGPQRPQRRRGEPQWTGGELRGARGAARGGEEGGCTSGRCCWRCCGGRTSGRCVGRRSGCIGRECLRSHPQNGRCG
jgi:hypothetical protein